MKRLVYMSVIATFLVATPAIQAELVLIPTKKQDGQSQQQAVPKVIRAYVYSISNNNSQFTAAIVIEPSDSWDGAVKPMFYVDNREVGGPWGIVANDGKISSVYCTVEKTDAEVVANALGVACVKRENPNFKLKVKFDREKKVYRLHEQKKKITIESIFENKIGMLQTVTNIGAVPFNVTLWTPKGKPYDFTLTVHHSGKELKYIGTPFSFGASGIPRTLARGESHSHSYDLADWYAFDKPGRYTVHIKYHTTLRSPRKQKAAWPENCEWAHEAWDYDFDDKFIIDVAE